MKRVLFLSLLTSLLISKFCLAENKVIFSTLNVQEFSAAKIEDDCETIKNSVISTEKIHHTRISTFSRLGIVLDLFGAGGSTCRIFGHQIWVDKDFDFLANLLNNQKLAIDDPQTDKIVLCLGDSIVYLPSYAEDGHLGYYVEKEGSVKTASGQVCLK